MNNAPKEGSRLNKFIASSGLSSRRGADDLIFEGSVTVNNEPCLTPGYIVKRTDHVKVNGRSIRSKETSTVIFYKLAGYVTTKSDEFDRETIYDLLPQKYSHLNHVGRLDQDSEGLLVMTNDGELANKLTHPRQKIEKEYIVTVNQPFEEKHLEQFLKGIYLEEGRATAKAVSRLSGRRISMTLETGMKRQIRMMCRALGYQVKKLTRIRIGAYEGLDLEPGEAREMEEGEVSALLRNPGKSRQAPAKKRVTPGGEKLREEKTAAARKRAYEQKSKRGGSSRGGGRGRGGRGGSSRPGGSRPSGGRGGSSRPSGGRGGSSRPSGGRGGSSRPSGGRGGSSRSSGGPSRSR